MDDLWFAFHPDHRATLVDRPNRFVVRAILGGKEVEAHCPNPGRMTELLYPGSTVILERAATGRKLAYTLVAVERLGPKPTVVPLASARANGAVEALVLPRLFPGGTVQPEFTLGPSRFDFLVEQKGVRHLVEVKACSEVEFGSALFPDAPSLRARKHLEHLAEWGGQGYVPHVVFAVVHGRPHSWAPNHHTDPEFARALTDLAPRLNLHAVVFQTQVDGATTVLEADLPIRLPHLGPDAGHLVRVIPGPEGWSIVVEWHPTGFEKAVARSPARTSFAVRGQSDQRQAFEGALAPLIRVGDPRHDRGFIDAIMRWRHTVTDFDDTRLQGRWRG